MVRRAVGEGEGEEEVARPGTRRRAAFAAATVLLVLLVAECATTLAYRATAYPSWYVIEGDRVAIEFDPVAGTRTRGRGRVALLARDANPFRARRTWEGSVWGNARGFPDSDEFGPRRRDAATPRVVVFGDSFTGGWLDAPWPERAQERLASAGAPMELSNLSHVGYGLANWDHLLTQWVAGERWQVDGVVLAVWGDDLRRAWFVSALDDEGQFRSGRVPTMAPEQYPRDAAAAAPYLQPWFLWAAPEGRYDDARDGAWKPSRGGGPFLTGRLLKLLGAGGPPPRGPALPPSGTTLESATQRFADGLRRVGAPLLVVTVPSRVSVDGTLPASAPFGEDARRFAERAGGEWLDGRLAFASAEPAEIDALWIPGDLHWNQQGSDVFAGFLAERLAEWGRRRGVLRR